MADFGFHLAGFSVKEDERTQESGQPDSQVSQEGGGILNFAAGALGRVMSLVGGSKGEEPQGGTEEKVRTSSDTEPGWLNVDMVGPDEKPDKVVEDPAHRGLTQTGNLDIECSEKIQTLEKHRVDQSKHISKLQKEMSALQSAVTDKESTIAKLKQEVRVLELKSTGKDPKHPKHPASSTSSSSSDGGGGERDWQAHSKEQCKKIVELKKEIRQLKEMAEMTSTDKESYDQLQQELEDDRDKLKEDFGIAREEIEQLKKRVADLEQELSTTKKEAFLPKGQESESCSNPKCVKSRARTNKLEKEKDEANVRVESLEKVVLSLKEKIQLLEVDKKEATEALEVARAEAAVYKSDFEEERKDRAQARGALEDLKKLKGAEEERAALYREVDTLRKHKIEQAQVVAKLRMDLDTANAVMNQLKKEVEKHASEKEEPSRRKYDRMKEQHSHAMQATVDLAGKVDALQKEKGELQKTCKKLENKVKKLEPKKLEPKKPEPKKPEPKKGDQKDKKLTRVQNSQPELTSASEQAKTEVLYQKERDRNEALQLEVEDLRSEMEHYKEINVMLKKLIKEEQVSSPLSSKSEYGNLPPSSGLPLEAGAGNFSGKQHSKAPEFSGDVQAPPSQSMNRRGSQGDSRPDSRGRGRGLLNTDQCPPTTLPLNSANNQNSSPTTTPIHSDSDLQQQQQFQSHPRAPFRAGGPAQLSPAGNLQGTYSAPQGGPPHSQGAYLQNQPPRTGPAYGEPCDDRSPRVGHFPLEEVRRAQQRQDNDRRNFPPSEISQGQHPPTGQSVSLPNRAFEGRHGHYGEHHLGPPPHEPTHRTARSLQEMSQANNNAAYVNYPGDTGGEGGQPWAPPPQRANEDISSSSRSQPYRAGRGGPPPQAGWGSMPQSHPHGHFEGGTEDYSQPPHLRERRMDPSRQQDSYQEGGGRSYQQQDHFGQSSRQYGEGGRGSQFQQRPPYDERGEGRGPSPRQKGGEYESAVPQQRERHPQHEADRQQYQHQYPASEEPPAGSGTEMGMRERQLQQEMYQRQYSGEEPPAGPVHKTSERDNLTRPPLHSSGEIASSRTYPLDAKQSKHGANQPPQGPVGGAKASAAVPSSKRPKQMTANHENQLQQSINHQIADMANVVQDELSEDNMYKMTVEQVPLDPNLECPLCGKCHRIGEIQKFRLHVDHCEGIKEGQQGGGNHEAEEVPQVTDL